MKVLLITQYFPPEIGAAASRWGDYVDIMAKKGHKVSVLCGMPNYPDGKYYPGYQNRFLHVDRPLKNLTIYRTQVLLLIEKVN